MSVEFSADELAAKIEACKAASAKCETVLVQPLQYEVCDIGQPIIVRAEPTTQSAEVGQLSTGLVVTGFPGSGWLRLAGHQTANLSGSWVFIGTRLSACWGHLKVQNVFSEAVLVAWSGLEGPGRNVAYSVEWRPADSPESMPSAGFCVTKKPRVTACLPALI